MSDLTFVIIIAIVGIAITIYQRRKGQTAKFAYLNRYNERNTR